MHEGCPYYEAFQVAKSVVEADDQLFNNSVRKQKLAEFAVVEAIFEKVTADCGGVGEDGACAKGMVINDARGFVFMTPGVEIYGRPDHGLGFKGSEQRPIAES